MGMITGQPGTDVKSTNGDHRVSAATVLELSAAMIKKGAATNEWTTKVKCIDGVSKKGSAEIPSPSDPSLVC